MVSRRSFHWLYVVPSYGSIPSLNSALGNPDIGGVEYKKRRSDFDSAIELVTISFKRSCVSVNS